MLGALTHCDGWRVDRDWRRRLPRMPLGGYVGDTPHAFPPHDYTRKIIFQNNRWNRITKLTHPNVKPSLVFHWAITSSLPKSSLSYTINTFLRYQENYYNRMAKSLLILRKVLIQDVREERRWAKSGASPRRSWKVVWKQMELSRQFTYYYTNTWKNLGYTSVFI